MTGDYFVIAAAVPQAIPFQESSIILFLVSLSLLLARSVQCSPIGSW